MSDLLKLRDANRAETALLIARNPGVPEFARQLTELDREIGWLETEAVTALRPALIAGVDPAMRTSGIAYADAAGDLRWATVEGVENLHVVMANVAAHAAPAGRVYLAIEYPTWTGRGTDAVRAAANCWIRAFKTAFPRRVRVLKITPARWMGAMIPGHRRQDRPADLYVPLALRLTGARAMEENAAAAVCVMAYGRARLARGEFQGVK
jgi:hypothetical protein